MKSLRETIVGNTIRINEKKYENINETVSKNIESKGFLDRLKLRLQKEGKNIGKETTLSLLNIYYVLIDHKVPLKDKLAAISSIVCFVFPESKMNSFLPDDAPDDVKNLIEYTHDFLDKYITDEIEEKSLELYNDLFE